VKKNYKRVVYVTNIPAPYKTGLFNALNERIEKFYVVFLAENAYMRKWDPLLRLAQFKFFFLRGFHFSIKRIEWVIHFNPGICKLLSKLKPDVVIISSWPQITTLLIIIWCRRNRIPMLIWMENTPKSSNVQVGRKLRIIIDYFKKKIIIDNMAGFIVSSKNVKNELIRLYEINNKPVEIAVHSVNNKFFINLLSVTKNRSLDVVITEHKPYILFVGQLINRKGLHLLLKAFSKVMQSVSWNLLVAGDGPLKREYIKLAKHLRINEKVIFMGYMQSEQLVHLYFNADYLILPSTREVWGLVTNESLSVGTPVICSIYAGSSVIINDGSNGFLFDPFDERQFTDVLINAWRRKKYFNREAVQQSTKNVTFENMAEAFVSAILKAENYYTGKADANNG